MKLLYEIDWNHFPDLIQRWAKLSPSARSHYLINNFNDDLSGSSLGNAAAELITAGLIAPLNQNRKTPVKLPLLRRTEKHRPFFSTLRKLHRHPLFDRSEYLRGYIDANFGPIEKKKFDRFDLHNSQSASESEVTDSQRVSLFLELNSTLLAGKLFSTRSTIERAKTLVKEFVRMGGSVGAAGLPAILTLYPLPDLMAALDICLGQCLIFIALRADTLDLALGLLPTVFQDLVNPESTADARPTPVKVASATAKVTRGAVAKTTRMATTPWRAASPWTGFTVPDSATPVLTHSLVIDDMTAFLVQCMAGALRLRQDGIIYAKAEKELVAALNPLPASLKTIMTMDPLTRIYGARGLLHDLGLIEGRRNIDNYRYLHPTKKAEAWLSQPDKNKFATLANYLREVWKSEASLNQGASYLHYQLRRGLENIYYFAIDESVMPGLWETLTALLKSPQPDFVLLLPFLQYLVTHHNFIAPLLENKKTRYYHYEVKASDKETLCQRLYDNFFLSIAIPFGLIDLASYQGKICFRFNSVARYLFELADDFSYGVPLGPTEIIVQPDFNITFLAPSPPTEALLARFAERQGRRLGTLFKITRTSIVAAAGAKMTCDQILQTLETVAKNGIPDNVRREITGWFAQCRSLTCRNALLLECDSPEDALLTVAKAGKSNARLITDRIVEIETDNPRQLFTKLRKEGLFITLERD